MGLFSQTKEHRNKGGGATSASGGSKDNPGGDGGSGGGSGSGSGDNDPAEIAVFQQQWVRRRHTKDFRQPARPRPVDPPPSSSSSSSSEGGDDKVLRYTEYVVDQMPDQSKEIVKGLVSNHLTKKPSATQQEVHARVKKLLSFS